MIRRRLAYAIALLPLTAQADITGATLYPSHAEVTWTEIQSVSPGQGTLEITGLPVSLQDQGIQVALAGLPGASVQQVQVERVEQEAFVAGETRRLQSELDAIEQRIQAQEDRIKSWNQQVMLMSAASSEPGELSPQELTEMAGTIQETTQNALKQIREIRQAMADDLAARDRLQRELAQVKHNAKASKTVRLAYQAPEAGELKAALTFQTRDAGWRSEYRARLTSEVEGRPGGEMALEHQAVVRQATGIDWNNVELRLSTANVRRGTQMPEPESWVVHSKDPLVFERSTGAKAAATLMMDAVGVNEGVTLDRSSRFTHSYAVGKPVSVPSGRAEQRLTIKTHLIPVDIATWMAPVLDPTGYIHASGTFGGDVPIPAGPVALYRDSQSIGRTTLPELAAGEAITLGFGVDDGVKVRVINEVERSGEEGMWKSEHVQRRQNRFDVTNHHPGAVAVRVFDRHPVSEQDIVTVQPLTVSSPSTRDVDGKKGVLAWDRVVPPGETLSIQSGFEVRVPEGEALPRL